jgi:hypothetical protein
MAKKKTPARRGSLMTLQQAEAETGVPYGSLRDMVLRGQLTRVAVGDSKRYWLRRTEVETKLA